METVTFKQQFTFPTESVKNFAIFLGWEEKLKRSVPKLDEEGKDMGDFIIEEYDNPETFVEFVEQRAKEHTLQFTKRWAEKLKSDIIAQQVAQKIEPTLNEQIVKPVEDALISEVVTSK